MCPLKKMNKEGSRDDNIAISTYGRSVLQWSAKMKTVFLVLALVLEDVVGVEDSNEDCTPAIAERCFRGFWNETLYSGKDSYDICSTVNDQISCAQDIIDDGCRKEQGRDNFDSWISGISAVYSFLCNDDQNLLNALLPEVEPRGKCFDLTSFVSCVERKAKVTHVTDMLYVTMDAVECNWILISFATCGSKVSSAGCIHVEVIISEALQIFFQEVKCGYVCGNSNDLCFSPIHLFVTLSLVLIVNKIISY